MIDQEISRTTHLYLARHGETEHNRLGMVQGRGVNVSLNREGRRQAEALAERASGMQLHAVYSSTLLRAQETAHIIAHRCGRLPIVYLSDLEEMSWGIYEGQYASPELKEAFAFMQTQWQSGNLEYAVERGESVLDVQTRSMRAMRFMLEEHSGRNILVVTHGRFLKVLIATLLEEYGPRRMEEIKHHNTGLNYLIYEDDTFVARYLNDTSHLQQVTV